MQYSISDLRPANPILSIGDRDFSISLITLNIEAIIKETICPLNEIQEYINKNPLIIFDIIWILIINKDFKNKEEFKIFIYKQAKTAEVSAKIKQALDDTFFKSMPKFKNKAKYDELLKISQSQTDTRPCYGAYYDRLAKRYSYTIDDFFNLTLGQLYILLTVSSDQTYEEIEVQAALQGRKLKPRLKFDDLDEKEDIKLDEDAKELLARLQREYKNGK